MAIESIGAVAAASLKVGKYTFNNFQGTTLTGINEVSVDPESSEEELFQQGCFQDVYIHYSQTKWSCVLSVQAGDITTLSALQGKTPGSTAGYGLGLAPDGTITGYLERRIYNEAGTTVLFTEVIVDLIPKHWGISGPMERADLDVPMTTYWEPYTLKDVENSGTVTPVVIRDTWTTSSPQTTFTPTQTPLLIDTSLNNQYALFVKVDGVRQVTGYSITPGTPVLTFDVDPGNGTVVEMLYVYDLP